MNKGPFYGKSEIQTANSELAMAKGFQHKTTVTFDGARDYLPLASYLSCSWGPDYDHPIVELERDSMKILQYELIGLNEEHLTVAFEFINKTEQYFMNVKGEYKDPLTEFDNEINIHLPIDTELYRGYDWKVKDGILTIVLFEKENQRPSFPQFMNAANDYAEGEPWR